MKQTYSINDNVFDISCFEGLTGENGILWEIKAGICPSGKLLCL